MKNVDYFLHMYSHKEQLQFLLSKVNEKQTRVREVMLSHWYYIVELSGQKSKKWLMARTSLGIITRGHDSRESHRPRAFHVVTRSVHETDEKRNKLQIYTLHALLSHDTDNYYERSSSARIRLDYFVSGYALDTQS